MFNLESAITDWQKQMRDAGIKFPTPLEELEIHLREEMERQMKSGLSEQKAFEISVHEIGQPKILTSEFKKSERTFMNQTVKMSAGIIGSIAGMALMTPGTIQMRQEMIMATGKLGQWLLGWALVGGSVIFLQRMFLPKLFKVESENVELTPVKQTMKIGAGMVVLLMGLAFTMPPVVQGLHEGAVRFDGVCYVVIGNALLLVGAVVAFCPYKKRVA
jgi:hypothetical protein